MKTAAHLLNLILIAGILAACNKTELNDIEPAAPAALHKDAVLSSSTGIVGNSIQQLTFASIYCQGHAFTVSIKKFTDEPPVIDAPGKRLPNDFFIYEEQSASKYLPVAGRMPDPGSYVLWRVYKIEFNPGFKPKQFYSRDEIMDAVHASVPSITLTFTGIVYEGRKFNAVERSFNRASVSSGE